ncbi:MAG: competence/damage-inducible protein A [Neomegalonema sp.]|nr:competence/damage-inducible protein A [Neomegalonema sp.]
MPQSSQPTAAMIVIGDEILSGRTQDANAHHLAGVMSEIGVRLVEIRVISDAHEGIVEAVNALRACVDYVFTSGGIGPTHDDITADAVAAAFGMPIGIREDARAILLAYYGDDQINDSRLRMARIPQGARLIDNPVSAAPGFVIGNVHVMAGVPVIFRAMLAGLRSSLSGGPLTLSHSFRLGVPEGTLAELLGALAAAHPACSIGIYPFYRQGPGCTIVLRSEDAEALAAARQALLAQLAAQGCEDFQEMSGAPS